MTKPNVPKQPDADKRDALTEALNEHDRQVFHAAAEFTAALTRAQRQLRQALSAELGAREVTP